MTQYVKQGSGSRNEAAANWGVRDLRRRPQVNVPADVGQGVRIYAIEVFENFTPCVTGDGAFEWEIPEDLDGAVLLKVESYVTTASSSGTVQVQVRNETKGVDMLSTKVTIDVGELNSRDSSTPMVVDLAHDDVDWGDHLNIDVDAVGTGTTGLGMVLYFAPAAMANIAVQGAKGDTGGVTAYMGAYNSGSTYTAGQSVSYGGSSYVAITNVPINVFPGVTPGWQTYWQVLAEGGPDTALSIQISNGGRFLDTGHKAIVEIPFDCTIVQNTLLADAAGSAVVDIRKDTYANYPPTAPDSIVASSPPTLSSTSKSIDTTLSGWTTAVAAGDTLWIHLTSVLALRILTLTLKLRRV